MSGMLCSGLISLRRVCQNDWVARILAEEELEQEESPAGPGGEFQADVTGPCADWILQGREGTQNLSPWSTGSGGWRRLKNLCQRSCSTHKVRTLL